MAALHDLLPPLMAAAHRDLSKPGRSLDPADAAGVGMLLGLSAEFIGETGRAEPDPDDPEALHADAAACLAVVRRVTKGGTKS